MVQMDSGSMFKEMRGTQRAGKEGASAFTGQQQWGSGVVGAAVCCQSLLSPQHPRLVFSQLSALGLLLELH